MTNNPIPHHRRSIRFKGYDYTSEGGYFITMVTHQRQPIFGEIIDTEMHLNHIGSIAHDEWFRTSQMRPYVELFDDEFVVMPNHLHGIIWITDLVGAFPPRQSVGAYCNTPQQDRSFQSPGIGIGAIIRGYKSAVTKRINELLNTPSSPVWQRNYYEHIITIDWEYEAIVEYIDANPRNWLSDRENPNNG